MTIQPGSSNASIRKPLRDLKTGDPAAHPRDCLMLLGSPPDMVHRRELRGTHFSTALQRRGDTNLALIPAYHPCWSGLQVQGTANSPDSMVIFHTPFPRRARPTGFSQIKYTTISADLQGFF